MEKPRRGNPTKWRQIWIPLELAKDLEDVALQSGLGLNEAATMLIVAGAHAIFQRDQVDPPKEQDATGPIRSVPDAPTPQ